jgi:hydrogenase maturation protease
MSLKSREVQPARPSTLVLGWGNLSRGDDALGPLFVAGLQAQLPAELRDQVEFLEDYQLQVEHALDLVGRKQVLLVDASLTCAAPFEARRVHARRDTSYTSHALSPEALLQVFADFDGRAPPPVTLLAIRGEAFELGEPMSDAAQSHLAAALAWGLESLRDGQIFHGQHKTQLIPLATHRPDVKTVADVRPKLGAQAADQHLQPGFVGFFGLGPVPKT